MRPTWTSLGQTVAVSVATILGTGILGLPVALHESGIHPFLVLFTFNLFAQFGVVIATTELLQRTLHQSSCAAKAGAEASTAAAAAKTSEDTPIAVGSSGESDAPRTDGVDDVDDNLPPSLHSLAENYIQAPALKFLFNLMVMGHFIFIIVAYVLAAPQAYAAIIPFISPVPVYVRTTLFLFVLSVLVFFFTRTLLPVLSAATLVKAVLLTLLVALTLTRGLSIRQTVTSNWSLPVLIDPLLMGTIALSGVVNLMPVTYQTCLHSLQYGQQHPQTNVHVLADKVFLAAYRAATCIGLFICYLLNVAWVYAVLLVVPQTSPPASESSSALPPPPSLQSADQAGQISTIPLMQVLQASNDRLNTVVAVLVNLFIAISVTISFLVMSVGMLHFMKGSVQSVDPQPLASSSWVKRLYNSLLVRYWIGGVAVVYIIALFNPAGLLHIMEGVTTLALNLEAGIFVVYMFYVARTRPQVTTASANGALDTGYLQNGTAAGVVTYLVMYFSVAVLVDALIYIPSLIFT